VSTKGLIGLKNAGMSEQVIEAVVNAGSAPATPPAAAAPGGSMKYGVRSEDKVDLEAAEKDARGLYKLTPKEPLKPGEYGFVLTYGMAAGASGRVYDFGVD
jgi:hypothetical protein